MPTDSLIAFVTLSFVLSIAHSAPTVYDQRQDGKLNVHADLENFLIVIASSGKSNDFGLMGSLALQQLLEARQKAHQTPASEKFEYKLEESSSDEGSEPYSVEILKLRKEDNKKSLDSSTVLARDANKPVLIQEHVKAIIPPETEQVAKKEVEVPKAVELKQVNLSRKKSDYAAEDVQVKVVHETKQEVDKEKKVKFQEEKSVYPVKLLGDAVEDCGPGRSRNKFGICEADVSYDV